MSDQYVNSEKRDVSGFTALMFKAMGRIDLVQGDHDELVIEAAPEILSRIQTTVVDNTLLIDYAEDWKDWTGFRLLSGDKIRFKLMMREVKTLSITGVGSLDCPSLDSPNLSLSITGPGLLTVGTLTTEKLDVALSGVGSVDLAGMVNDMNVTLSGAGSFRGARLQALKADMHLSGVGSAAVWAKETLNVRISGAGMIEYYGNPTISQNNTGLGVLKFMGNR